MKLRSRWIYLLIVILVGLVQTSCETKRPPSVLIIAVDSLPFSLSLCSRDTDENKSGFSLLCHESIRFTHAMTPSTLSVPTLASLLTGLYPFEHGLRHNGSSGLSPRFTTVAEVAVRKGYRTGFFSGGAPVWRRTGLQQGFELFDDLVPFSSGMLFRPLSQSVDQFQEWLDEEIDSSSFMAVLYAPDLNFTDTVTETLSGERRGLSYESQLEEMEETLDDLIRFLKKKNRWDDTMVILVGLNGRESSPRDGEIEPMNLHHENTQVSLFIKPPQKPRDEALRWTVDRNVSVADLGVTLMDFFGEPLPPKESEFPLYSLLSGIHTAQPAWPEDRPILMESAWSEWQGLSSIRAAILRNQELIIYDQPPRTYNTLIDRFEMTPLPGQQVDATLLSALRKNNFRSWPPLGSALMKTFTISPLNWLSPLKASTLHQELVRLTEDRFIHPRALRWAAQSALEQKDWNLLKSLGQRMNKPEWEQVADRHLGKKVEFSGPCLSLLQKKNPSNEDIKKCPDELFTALIESLKAKRKDDRDKDFLRRRFQRLWEGAQIDLRILKANAALGLTWLPMKAEENIPTRTALALSLPEAR